MLKLSLEYIGLVFLANMGVLQLAAGHNKLRGMSFFDNNIYTFLFGVITITPSLFILFIWNNLFPTGIIEGAQQAGLFFVSFVISLVLTLSIASFLHRDQKDTNINLHGIEIMRSTTYFSALRDISDRKKL